MYFGESAIQNYYFENSFNNDITLLNELSVADIGKFIIDKLKEFWNKILDLIKIIKSKVADFFSKIFKKNKKVEKYETIISKEESFVFTEEVKNTVVRIFSGDTSKFAKENVISNYYNVTLCTGAAYELDGLLDLIINSSKSIDTITSDKFTAYKTINNKLKYIKENFIDKFDTKKINITYRELIEIKDREGASYLSSIKNTFHDENFTNYEMNFLSHEKSYKNMYDEGTVEIKCIKIKSKYLKSETSEKIKNVIDYFTSLKQNFSDTKNALSDSEFKQNLTDYIESLKDFLNVFQTINTKLLNSIAQENKLDEELEKTYLSKTIPNVQEHNTDTNTTKINNDKDVIKKDLEERTVKSNKSKYSEKY